MDEGEGAGGGNADASGLAEAKEVSEASRQQGVDDDGERRSRTDLSARLLADGVRTTVYSRSEPELDT